MSLPISKTSSRQSGSSGPTGSDTASGAGCVAELAARQPERVARAVLLDPALTVLPHVAYDMAELERADVSFTSAEEAAQARFDSGRVLLAPFETVVADAAEQLEPGPDGRLRYRYCKSAVITAWSVMTTSAPGPHTCPPCSYWVRSPGSYSTS